MIHALWVWAAGRESPWGRSELHQPMQDEPEVWTPQRMVPGKFCCQQALPCQRMRVWQQESKCEKAAVKEACDTNIKEVGI